MLAAQPHTDIAPTNFTTMLRCERQVDSNQLHIEDRFKFSLAIIDRPYLSTSCKPHRQQIDK